jgi:hypothetical protein
MRDCNEISSLGNLDNLGGHVSHDCTSFLICLTHYLKSNYEAPPKNQCSTKSPGRGDTGAGRRIGGTCGSTPKF